MLRNLKRTKCKAAPGTTVNALIIPAIFLANVPRTVAEVNDGVSGYVKAVGDEVRIGEVFVHGVEVGTTLSKFSRFRMNINSGDLKFDSVGEKGFEAFTNMFAGEVVGGSMDEVREFAQEINKYCGHVILVEVQDSKDWAVIGDKDNPVYVNWKGQIGKKAGDKNVAAFDVKDESGLIYRTYPKALALSIHPEA